MQYMLRKTCHHQLNATHTKKKTGWALYTARRAFSTLTKTWSVAGEKKHIKYIDSTSSKCIYSVNDFAVWLKLQYLKYIVTKYLRFQYSILFKLTVQFLDKYVGQIHNCIIEFLFEFKRKHNCGVKKLFKKKARACLHTSAQHIVRNNAFRIT